MRRHVDVVLQLEFCLVIILPRHELDDQGILDREHRVVVEVLAVLIKDLSGDWLITLDQHLGNCQQADNQQLSREATYNQMNMSWSVRVSIQQLQQLARRAVIRDGVRCRSQAIKRIFAVGIGDEFPAEVAVHLVLVLLLIQAWKRDLSAGTFECLVLLETYRWWKLPKHQWKHLPRAFR